VRSEIIGQLVRSCTYKEHKETGKKKVQLRL